MYDIILFSKSTWETCTSFPYATFFSTSYDINRSSIINHLILPFFMQFMHFSIHYFSNNVPKLKITFQLEWQSLICFIHSASILTSWQQSLNNWTIHQLEKEFFLYIAVYTITAVLLVFLILKIFYSLFYWILCEQCYFRYMYEVFFVYN